MEDSKTTPAAWRDWLSKDLIAYLFRPGPYIRRLSHLHPRLVEMTQDLTLGDWVRRTAKLELDSVVISPLMSLHTFVETVLPNDPMVRDTVYRLERWANLYERVFTAYAAPLREDQSDLNWLGMAEEFSTVAGGAFVRSQTRAIGSDSGVDSDMLGNIVSSCCPRCWPSSPGTSRIGNSNAW